MYLIRAVDLCLGYEGKEILHDLTFEINAGDSLCVLGENGSGKSTLLRTMLGLQQPLSGRILLGDGLRPGEIGYLPQQTQVQKDFPATVWEIALSGCQGRCGLRPFSTRAEKRRAAENLARMGVEGLARRCYRELSGGQQQRVLLARALCATGKLLLLDEPVTGLDPQAAADLYRLIGDLHRDGVAVMMITHDPENALPGATHVLRLGSSVFFGTKEEYLAAGMNGTNGKARTDPLSTPAGPALLGTVGTPQADPSPVFPGADEPPHTDPSPNYPGSDPCGANGKEADPYAV